MSVQKKEILVAVVGVGLVGGELIGQLLSIPANRSPFKLVSLTSSKTTLYASPENPISAEQLTTWKSQLAASSDKADLNELTSRLKAWLTGDRQVVVVDNTSNDDVAGRYPEWLAAGFSVATPNKKAFSGDKALFDQIVKASQQTGAKWLNESTVGAGLPVINTLKEMVASGDKVKKIEGVFSGTMSYIFNEFSTGKTDGPAFSSVVAVAREKGYTEPHPADDLNGYDVARKLTIVSRIISAFSSEPTNLPELDSFLSVKTQSLIPSALEGIPTGDEFIARLPEFDSEFAKLREEAAKEGKVLRFVGVVDVENGQVKAGLEKYPTTHPFATSLGGSDNIIMYHTERYSPRPLIVQGAGAGAAVTAMGVLGDLLKLA
ncbi:aspartate kinase homoserine dehydrogenase [Coprinopsis cinerea okayama7|uniref:Homoserine dehydrogenase n=1 Tax=Coprinopsis cinerea (strain Okayama-7 / 130 / ATCC MYA-4618 / FGSC 9003) TaxID=240176 RepID=A8NBZ4_COPC7|nr:aspartate kinase homoserine dehydrogenase [Coprinopsis cinerea okayama7\|eukprot:XP_001832352.1 aspartate kinase homoserine dehydrogenase [Coprinopsis cinerea okayama7\